jgi:transposase
MSHRAAGERFGVSAALIEAVLQERPDTTIRELRRSLSGRGHQFGFGTLQRFLARHKITRKKRPRTPQSKSARTF